MGRDVHWSIILASDDFLPLSHPPDTDRPTAPLQGQPLEGPESGRKPPFIGSAKYASPKGTFDRGSWRLRPGRGTGHSGRLALVAVCGFHGRARLPVLVHRLRADRRCEGAHARPGRGATGSDRLAEAVSRAPVAARRPRNDADCRRRRDLGVGGRVSEAIPKDISSVCAAGYERDARMQPGFTSPLPLG